MKQIRVISLTVLLLLFGTSAFAYAKQGPQEKGRGGQKNQHAQQAQRGQRKQQAQRSQRTQRAQRSQQAQRAQRSQHAQQVQRGRQQGQRAAYNRGNNGFHGNGNNGNHYGRIPDDRYRANFGRGHAFRMGHPQFINGYQRFQYGGYWFGYRGRWPSGWGYDDDVYVSYIGGTYYMYNRRHPGIRITLNLF